MGSDEVDSAWVGYDIPCNELESLKYVRELRKQGVKKERKIQENHVTCAFFQSKSRAELDKETMNFPRESKIKVIGRGSIGEYQYLSVDSDEIKEVQNFYSDRASTMSTPHISLGGEDPYSDKKPVQELFEEPIILNGKLIFCLGRKDNKKRYFVGEKND